MASARIPPGPPGDPRVRPATGGARRAPFHAIGGSLGGSVSSALGQKIRHGKRMPFPRCRRRRPRRCADKETEEEDHLEPK